MDCVKSFLCLVAIMVVVVIAGFVGINNKLAVQNKDICVTERYNHDNDVIDSKTWNEPYPVFPIIVECQ